MSDACRHVVARTEKRVPSRYREMMVIAFARSLLLAKATALFSWDYLMNALFATELDDLCVNTLRFLAVDAVEQAMSGHPGLPLGAAPMAYVLWTRLLKHHPLDPHRFDRDRFVLSAGHGSAMLYALLHLCGYDLPLEQLRQFRQWGSRTPGHPERGLTAGVEITTGPLGQGFANGIGMAMAEANLAARYNRDGFTASATINCAGACASICRWGWRPAS